MSEWAKPGARCVCIRDIRHRNGAQMQWAPNLPVKGRSYTIRCVGVCSVSGVAIIKLVELRNPVLTFADFDEVGFNLASFRPLIGRTEQDDVGLFTHHLTGAGSPVLAQ